MRVSASKRVQLGLGRLTYTSQAFISSSGQMTAEADSQSKLKHHIPFKLSPVRLGRVISDCVRVCV